MHGFVCALRIVLPDKKVPRISTLIIFVFYIIDKEIKKFFFSFVSILSVSTQSALHPFETERQHVTSDRPGQDAGDRVLHLHPDFIACRRSEHHD